MNTDTTDSDMDMDTDMNFANGHMNGETEANQEINQLSDMELINAIGSLVFGFLIIVQYLDIFCCSKLDTTAE